MSRISRKEEELMDRQIAASISSERKRLRLMIFIGMLAVIPGLLAAYLLFPILLDVFEQALQRQAFVLGLLVVAIAVLIPFVWSISGEIADGTQRRRHGRTPPA